MGNSESNSIHDFRSHNIPLKLPMPDNDEIDERFERVIVSLCLLHADFFVIRFQPHDTKNDKSFVHGNESWLG